MRVTLTPDGPGATTAVIERDDGVVYAMGGPVAGPVVPHDAVHLLVERELRVRDGIWGCIADGAVYRSMTHVSGRRPPRAAERSGRLIRQRRGPLHRAELLAGLVERVARDPGLDERAVAALTGQALSTQPGELPPARLVLEAAQVLRLAGLTWQRDRRLVLDWPAPRRPTGRG